MIDKFFVIGVYLVAIGGPFVVIGWTLEYWFEKRGKNNDK